MNDRLGDLEDDWVTGGSDDFDSAPLQPSKDENADPNTFQHQQQQQEQHRELVKNMTSFFQHVETIKMSIENLSKSARCIEQMDDEAKSAVSEREEKRISKEIEAIIQETNVKAKQAKKILSLLRQENKEYETEGTANASDIRERENYVNTLTRKLNDEIKEIQNVQQAYKENIWKKAVQQIKYVKEDATPEEVEQIMKTEGRREELMQQSILQGGLNENIKQTNRKEAGKDQWWMNWIPSCGPFFQKE